MQLRPPYSYKALYQSLGQLVQIQAKGSPSQPKEEEVSYSDKIHLYPDDMNGFSQNCSKIQCVFLFVNKESKSLDYLV
jgi:hypothetical protein